MQDKNSEVKTCNKGFSTYLLSEYSVAKSNLDGLSKACKKYKSEYTKNYVKTRKGKVTQIYNSQKASSKQRGHSRPLYTKDELENWMYEHGYEDMFIAWKNSGYTSDNSPSVDRIDPMKGYSFNNIQLVLWKNNNEKAYEDRKSCKHVTKQSRQVLQLNSEGKVLAKFESIASAARQTTIQRTNINACCTGKQPHAGGYYWKYAQNI